MSKTCNYNIYKYERFNIKSNKLNKIYGNKKRRGVRERLCT